MTDILLDRKTHDLAVFNGDLMLVESISRESVAQEIKQALLIFSGEWYLDVLRGRPYFEVVFIKQPDRVIVESLFKQAILEINNVIEFVKFQLDFDNVKRQLQFNFAVKIITGDIVVFNEGLFL